MYMDISTQLFSFTVVVCSHSVDLDVVAKKHSQLPTPVLCVLWGCPVVNLG